MTYKLSDGRIVTVAQKKSDPSIKVAYLSKHGEYMKLAFSGTFDGLRKWLKHQKDLADKAETRSMISDICGTSYSAAIKDMGLCKI